jgi:succinoglycan biosynthesis transport protein ExoP
MRDLLAVVFRQRRLALVAFVLVLAAAIGYREIAPCYESEMKVLLRRGRVDPVVAPTPSQAELIPQGVTEEEVNSEAELLHDGQILRTVVQSTGLVSEGSSWFWSLVGDSEEKCLARAVKRMAKRLTVEPVRKTALINVKYESSDPEQTAKVLRSLADAYLERHHQVHRASGEFGFFDQQVTQSRHNLEVAELQLAEFTRDQGVVSASQERDTALQKLSDADADHRRTQVELAENSERIRALQGKLSLLPERTLTQMRNSDNPELMQKMKARLLELELQRTDLLIEFEPSYRLVKEVEQKIAQTKASIVDEDRAPIRDQTSDLEPNHAWAKSELVKAEVEARALGAHASAEGTLLAHYRDTAHQLADQAIAQERLVRDLKAAEERYLLYVDKREEARIGDALDQGGILNVAIAEQPVVPELPKLSELSFGLLGLAFAGTVSVSLAFVADYLSPAFRTPDEVVAFLRAPVLASLPQKEKVDAEEVSRGLL